MLGITRFYEIASTMIFIDQFSSLRYFRVNVLLIFLYVPLETLQSLISFLIIFIIIFYVVD